MVKTVGLNIQLLFKWVIVIGVTLAFLFTFHLDGNASTNASTERIIVKFKKSVPGATIDQVVTKNKGKKLGTDAKLGFTKVRTVKGVPLNEQIAAYKKDPNVLYAEPDYVVNTLYTPNDPSYWSQWHLPKMNLPATWDKTVGSSSIIIAVVDTGVDSDHADLTGKFAAGYNTITNNTNWNDDQGHGTHVAGIAAGATDNGIGTAGVCMSCRIMPIKAMSSNGSGYTSDIAEGVRWAADNGAKIINLSLGSTNYSLTMIDAINYAYNKGALIVAAAGNDNSGAAYYPAAYNNVLAVAATDSNNNRASFSNYGAHVDVSAPGVSILATTFDGGYGYKQGTSMATPNVAGVAGLIFSYNPTMTPAQVEQLLKNTASDLGSPGKDDYYGFGLVNALAAINNVVDSTAPSAPTSLTATVRTTSISLSWLASTDNVGVTSYEVFSGATSLGTTTSTGFTATGLTTNTNYTFTVRAKDAAGNVSAASTALTTKPQASTNAYSHTITLDKANDFNGNTNVSGNETFSTSTNNFFSYVTWDATNVYIGYSGADLASTTTDASTKWLLMYFGGTGGTTNGVTYNSQSPNLPFSAKYHVRWKVDGSYFNRQIFQNGAWADAGTYAGTAFERNNAGYVELRIPRADLGNPTTLPFVSYIINEKPNSEWTWAVTPSQAVTADGYDRDFSRFYEFDLNASVAAASQVFNYNFQRTSNTSTTASLSFAAQTGATTVKIQQSTNGGTTWSDSTTSASLNATSTSATVTGLTANTSYKFRLVVTGGNNEGNSAIVNEVMFVDVTAPTVPANLTITEKTSTTIAFSWTASTDNVAVSGYDVYRGATLLGTTTATQYTASGLTADTSYSFTVRAKDAAGNVSAASSTLTVSTNPIITSHVHTITLDGNNDFFNSNNPDKKKNETFTTSTTDMFSYITWDATNIYFGYSSSDITGNTSNASQKWIWVYVGGSGGTTTGVNYSGQQPNLPFAAKYHFRFKVDGGYTNRQMWNGTAWQDMGNYSWGSDQARNDANRYVEFKIPRSHLGADTGKTLQWVSNLVYEDVNGNFDAMWASVPSNAFSNGDGFDRDFSRFYEFDLSSPSAPAAQVYNHQLAVTASNANSVTLSFVAPSGASDVKIQQSTDSGTTWTTSTTAAALVASSTSATVTGLTPNTPYKFRLQVVGGTNDGSSAIVNATLAPDTVAPSVPSGLAVSNLTAYSLTLTWNASTDSNTGVKEYHVYRGATLLGKTSATSYAVSGLTEYTVYLFSVRAEDAAGNLSAASSALDVTTLDISVPTLPTMFEYSAVTVSGFSITWSGATDGGSGIKEYEIYRNGTLVTTVANTVSSYTFSGLNEFTSHNVNIKVRDNAGNVSELSNTITVRTLDVTAPSVPTGLTTSDMTTTSFTLSWIASTDSASGVVAYRVFDGTTLVDTVTSGTSLAINSLAPYSEHSMTVRAVDDSGNVSAASTAIVVRTLSNWNDVSLSANEIVENSELNATIGSFSAMGAEIGQLITYSLVSGTGSDHNSSFNILYNQLRNSVRFNFEAQTTYSIRVKALDTNGATMEKVFTITVTNENEVPTDIALSATSIAENAGANATVGTLSATDPDAGTTFTFTLVTGSGSTDNGSFNISGSSLRANASFDFETKSIYNVRVQVSDGALSYAEAFTVTVTDVAENGAPTDIALSATSIAENAEANASVGTLSATDPDAGATFTFSLVSGTGSTDNGSFNISGASLRANASFDFETKASYSVRVQVSDGTFNYVEVFMITVTNVNEAPTDIALSATSIAENSGANATVGTLSATDPDAGTTLTFTLVTGSGSTNNGSFNISGTSLRANASFDFETKASYSVRVQVSDGALSYAEAFSITVTDVAENGAPTDIALSATSIAENAGVNATVGMLSATDPDAGATFTFTLVSGTGSTDNSSFNISGTSLRATASLDFETKSSYSVRLQVSDGALTYAEVFTITVTNVNEAPTFSAMQTLIGATGGQPFIISYASLLTNAMIQDVDSTTFTFRVASVLLGTLTKGGTAVTAGTTTLSSGESLVWTPAAGTSGNMNAFSLIVSDGSLDSAETVNVVVTVVQSSDTVPPIKPGSMVATSKDIKATNVKLTWTAGSDNVAVKEYFVYRNDVFVAKVAGLTYTVTGLTKETSYTFKVTTIDTSNLESVSGATITVKTTRDTTAPTPPTSFTVTNETRTGTVAGFTLNWAPSTDDVAVAGYKVYLNNVLMTPDVTSGTSFTFSNLVHKTKYLLTVRAFDQVNSDGKSNLSPASMVFEYTTLLDTVAPHVAPSAASVTNIGSVRATVSWTAGADDIAVVKYRVYAKVAQTADGLDGSEAETLLTEVNGISATIAIMPGREQALRVAAVDAEGNESSRTALIATQLGDATTFTPSNDLQKPEAPVGLRVTYVEEVVDGETAGKYILHWSNSFDNDQVAAYKVYAVGANEAEDSEITSGDTTCTTSTGTQCLVYSENELTDKTIYIQAVDRSGLVSAASANLKVSKPSATFLANGVSAVNFSGLFTKGKAAVSYVTTVQTTMSLKVYAYNNGIPSATPLQTGGTLLNNVVVKAGSKNLNIPASGYVDGTYLVEFTIAASGAERVYHAVLVVAKAAPVITPTIPSVPYEIRDAYSFNGATKTEVTEVEIGYSLNKSALVTVVINDSKRKRVRTILTSTRLLGGESYSFVWDGNDAHGVEVNDGVYTVVFSGVDPLGVKAALKTVTVRVERAVPNFSLTPASIKPSATGATIHYSLTEAATITNNFEIFKIDENGDEIAQPSLIVSGAVGAKKSGANKFTVKGALTVGTYRIKMAATDAFGKSSGEVKLTLTVDGTLPVVSALSAADISGNSGSNIEYTLSEDARVTVTLRSLSASGKILHTIVNNQQQSATDDPISVVWNGKNSRGQNVPVSNGSTVRYFIVVQATDTAGNVSTAVSDEISISA